MMNAKEAVTQEWNDAATVAAWRRWYPKITVQTREATKALLDLADIPKGARVLDLASGPGQPGFTIASQVGPGGSVTLTDFSQDMLEAAKENARSLGIANVRFEAADAESLQFDDGAFDAVTCRFGLMYFPDAVGSLREARRVLRKSGRATYLVWGSPDQPFIASTVGQIFRHLAAPPPPPPPDAPTPFRFAGPGSLSKALEAAGFLNVVEKPLTIPFPWPGSPSDLWEHFQEVAAPFRPLIDGLDADRKRQLDEDVLRALGAFVKGDGIEMTAKVIVATGTA
jgi:SAM-dependent methyltransferase